MDRRKHLVSCILLAPSRIDYSPLAAVPHGRARLLAAMRQAKAEYNWWLANPCLPHVLAELAPRIAPTVKATHAAAPPGSAPGMHAPTTTNVGRVEQFLAPVWPRDSDGTGGACGEAVIRVDEMHLACRWCAPCVVVACVCVYGVG